MTKNNAAGGQQPASSSAEPKLDSRYGEIGISAVAAALPYQSQCKNPAYAPSTPQPDRWPPEMAA
jgi:hypothetical protein